MKIGTDSFRRLDPDETIKVGDFYSYCDDEAIHPVNARLIGETVGLQTYVSCRATFWRKIN